MSIIYIKYYKTNTTEAYCYVDSLNETSVFNEMNKIALQHIKENIVKDDVWLKLDKFTLKDVSELTTAKDGYYIVFDKGCLTLYKKITLDGYIYNSVYYNRIFKLSSVKCKKVIPKVEIENSDWQKFKLELQKAIENKYLDVD